MTGRRSFAELTERGKCGTYFAGVRSELFGVIRSSVQSCAGMGQCGPWNEHGNSMVRERMPGELAKVFGDNLRLARLELRLSQDELAAVSGIGRKQISAIENGANTTIETIERLAKHLNRTPAELLTKHR